jgi:hypothetical protein
MNRGDYHGSCIVLPEIHAYGLYRFGLRNLKTTRCLFFNGHFNILRDTVRWALIAHSLNLVDPQEQDFFPSSWIIDWKKEIMRL